LKHQLTTSLLIAILVFSLVGSVNAERPRLSKPSEREFETRTTKYLLGAKLNAGSVIGEGADEIEKHSTDFADKLVYGLGLVTEYNLKPAIGIGLNFDYGWKSPVVDSMESLTFYLLAGSISYKLSPHNRSTFWPRTNLRHRPDNRSAI
jgi:hypothetical protein